MFAWGYPDKPKLGISLRMDYEMGAIQNTLSSESLKSMSRTCKTAYKAWQAYPYGMKSLGIDGDWLYGPTFIVRLREEDKVASVFLAKNTQSVFSMQADLFKEAANKWLEEEASLRGEYITEVPNAGHTKRQELVKDKDGAMVPKGGQKCTGRFLAGKSELSYPLYMLAKSAGAKTYKLVENGPNRGLYCYDKDHQVVAVVAPRDVSEYCEVKQAKQKA
jgi:hypothetical protein